MTVYQEIFEVIKQRKADYEAGKAQENSYTAYLFDKGVDKICKGGRRGYRNCYRCQKW